MGPHRAFRPSDDVTYRVDRRCAIITIDRPEVRNAISPSVALGIEAAIDAAEGDEDVWVLILTGTPPAFCAGADLNALREGRVTELRTERGGFAGVTHRIRTKPLIAAVEGAAVAGGAEIVLACDLVVAAENARFGLPEVKRGLIAAAGGLVRLGRRIPLNLAMECALTGDPIDASTAYQHGLVNALCPAGTVMETALELAGRITDNAPLAVRESRAIILMSTYEEEQAWRGSEEGAAKVAASEDMREGVEAFIEKRAPNWKGR